MLEDKPDDESRARLLAFMQSNLQQGLIEMEDAILIETTDNLKVAQQILAYKIRKRKEELESKAMVTADERTDSDAVGTSSRTGQAANNTD